MKFLFSLVFFYFVFYSDNTWADNYIASYKIKTNGVLIGYLDWNLSKEDDSYAFNIELKSKGFLSKLFVFKGSYSAIGNINNKEIIPSEYFQIWKTNKKEREVKIFFRNNKIFGLMQNPKEQEALRVNLDSLNNYSDPLSSFLMLLNGSTESKTIDGRRVYTFNLYEQQGNEKKYIIENFTNLWADHKRNNLNYISFDNSDSQFLPNSIYISLKGRLFKVLID